MVSDEDDVEDESSRGVLGLVLEGDGKSNVTRLRCLGDKFSECFCGGLWVTRCRFGRPLWSRVMVDAFCWDVAGNLSLLSTDNRGLFKCSPL